MVRSESKRLSGKVETEKAYVGTPAEGKCERGAFGKKIVVVMAECRDEAIGRIRLAEVSGVGGGIAEACNH